MRFSFVSVTGKAGRPHRSIVDQQPTQAEAARVEILGTHQRLACLLRLERSSVLEEARKVRYPPMDLQR